MLRWLSCVLALYTLLFPVLPLKQNPTPMGSVGPFGGNHIVFVQACRHIDGAATTSHVINIGSTGSCGVPQNPVAGDLVVVWEGYRANPTSQSCADTLSNTWTSVVSTTNLQGYCWSILTTGGAADSLTFTSGSSVVGVQISTELSGSAASPLDGTATTDSKGTGLSSWNGVSYTSTNANDIIFGCGSFNTNTTITAGTGYTIDGHGQTANAIPYGGYCEYQIVTATAAYTPAATSAASTSNLFTFTVGFKSN